MLYNIIRLLCSLFTIIFSQELYSNELYQFENKSLKGVSLKSSANTSEVASKMVEIETRDGNILLGYVIEENDDFYKLRTKDGMIIDIPRVSVINLIPIETKENDGKVYRADPNKSLYIFAPSAFPIENKKSYCRDFCLFFPSYNRGFNNNFSLQLGAFVAPGIPIDEVPLVLSGKFSLPKVESKSILKFSTATGAMYVNTPENFGLGIIFGTITLGDNFTHLSGSFGFGYSRDGSDWELQEKPIYNLSGNYRYSNSIAFVGETWFLPDLNVDDNPFMFSVRFIGRRFAVDLGALVTINLINENTIPLPILNFTYHPS